MDAGPGPEPEPAPGPVGTVPGPSSPSSRRARLGTCGASVVVLACLVWACISRRWHCFEVYVAPAEIYQMYQAVTHIVPQTQHSAVPSPELAKDEEPKLAFELEAGLFSASAVHLCRPREQVFAEFVDEKQCQAKLSRFCYNILDEKPKDPMVRHFFQICQKAVHHGSVSFSLVLEPFTPHKDVTLEESDSFEGMRASLEWRDEDSDPDICETLVNCELLAARRPWNFALLGLTCLALLVASGATASMALALVKLEESKFVTRGCHLLFAVAWILVALIALDLYIGEKFAVEDIFHTEDLFYYMLPDATPKPLSSSSLFQEDMEVQWPKRLQKRLALSSLIPGEASRTPHLAASSLELGGISRALREIPAAKWQNALMVLCGNLMAALVSGQMSSFLDPLKDAAKRAWSKSDRVLNTWLLYLEKSLVDSPNHGNDVVVHLLEDLDTMKPVDEICAKENCGGGQQHVKSMGKKFFGHFPALFKDKIADVRTLIQKCRALLKKFKHFWKSVHEPIEKILALVVEAVKSASSDGVLGLLNTVVNVLGQPELIEDLHLLFQRLFTDFPSILLDVRQLADGFMALIQGFTAAMQQVQGAAKLMKSELLQGSGSEAASSLRAKTGQVLDEKMAQAASIWQVTTEKQESALQKEGNGTSALQTASDERGGSYPLLSILSNFATGGSLCSPAARIGSIFLSEIEYMHSSKRGFETSRGGLFKHFGYVTFGLMTLSLCIFAGHLLFSLGYLLADG